MNATVILAPVAAALAVAVAIGVAPIAFAGNGAECEDNSVTSVCSTSGQPTVVATPGGSDSPMGGAGGMGYGHFGAVPTLPVWLFN